MAHSLVNVKTTTWAFIIGSGVSLSSLPQQVPRVIINYNDSIATQNRGIAPFLHEKTTAVPFRVISPQNIPDANIKVDPGVHRGF